MNLEQEIEKLGIENFEALNEEEKKTFREWEDALNGRKITQKEYKEWLKYELDIAVSRLTDIELSKEAEIFRKVEVRFIKKILNFINSPLMEKLAAKKSIEALVKK